jgi:hypothetical protein
LAILPPTCLPVSGTDGAAQETTGGDDASLREAENYISQFNRAGCRKSFHHRAGAEVFFLDIPFYRTEWHRVCIFRPRLAEHVAAAIKKGSHVLVEGSLISTAYEREVGKGKKAKTTKQTFWCIRADVVRKLDRGEPEPETVVSGSNASDQIAQTSDGDSF